MLIFADPEMPPRMYCDKCKTWFNIESEIDNGKHGVCEKCHDKSHGGSSKYYKILLEKLEEILETQENTWARMEILTEEIEKVRKSVNNEYEEELLRIKETLKGLT
jgi:hypothetical protein